MWIQNKSYIISRVRYKQVTCFTVFAVNCWIISSKSCTVVVVFVFVLSFSILFFIFIHSVRLFDNKIYRWICARNPRNLHLHCIKTVCKKSMVNGLWYICTIQVLSSFDAFFKRTLIQGLLKQKKKNISKDCPRFVWNPSLLIKKSLYNVELSYLEDTKEKYTEYV